MVKYCFSLLPFICYDCYKVSESRSMSVNCWSVAEDAGEGTLVLVWFPGS